MWYNVSNGDNMFFFVLFLHFSNHFTTLAVNSYETISRELSGENKNQQILLLFSKLKYKALFYDTNSYFFPKKADFDVLNY